jgi:hypothetical protein
VIFSPLARVFGINMEVFPLPACAWVGTAQSPIISSGFVAPLKSQIVDLTILLCDHPAGTTADITEYAVAFWDGSQFVGSHISAFYEGEQDELFDIEDAFPDIVKNIADWFQTPSFT